MAKLTKVKQISFSETMLKNIEPRLEILGISFPEYIRNLVIMDLREEIPSRPATPAEEKAIRLAHEDYAAGRYETFKTAKDMRKYYTKLLGDNLDE